jgi:hypothetical protein
MLPAWAQIQKVIANINKNNFLTDVLLVSFCNFLGTMNVVRVETWLHSK